MSLRAVGAQDLDLLGRWRNDPEHESVYGDFLPMIRRQNSYRERWEVNGLLSEDDGLLMVCLEAEPVGTIGWHPVHYGPNRGSQALNLGIALAPAARGKGVGSAAPRLACAWLFGHTTVNRIEASTDVTNRPAQRALEKAGFTREGILRGAQFRSGEWHDLVQYSRLRHD
ncbi:GNAT family N-acetyltransferase [Kineosporia babensis]|uniref:GNAT family N-acetyltransferase n=1 Tax=Kineosporia babensis TaxID=499548 RepID=A0A9X1NCC3_9ACTN|nr:GNAT family N-acetyltransferase [Kineosporia babensis]